MSIENVLEPIRVTLPELQVVADELCGIVKKIDTQSIYTKTKQNILETLTIVDQGECSSQDIEKIHRAILLMLYLHIDQKDRSDGPYPQHTSGVMRKSLDGLTTLHVDMLIGAALHDSFEDQLEKLLDLFGLSSSGDVEADRDLVQEKISKIFGDRVGTIIRGLSNGELPRGVDDEVFIQAYVDHVKKATSQDIVIFFVKLCDFNENGLFLHTNSPAARLRLTRKYKAIFEYFLQELKDGRGSTLKTEEYISDQIKKLTDAYNDALEFLGTHF